MINEYYWIIAIVVAINLHELGHFLLAKSQGIYKGIGILPTPHIKMTKPFLHKWDYMSGFLMSIPSIPFFMWAGIEIWIGFVFLIAMSLGDLIPIIFWKSVKNNCYIIAVSQN